MSYPATCTPEEMGLPSDAVIDFLDYVEESRINLYSFMLIKDGKTVTEAYYKPFDASSKHRIYSCTKSVSALAVGLLLKDGLVELDAPLISYFPECENPDAEMARVTVRDALKMAVPQWRSSYCRTPADEGAGIVLLSDWTKSFFTGRFKADKPAGTIFNYNSTASYVLGDLVTHLAGKSIVEYLRPVFDKIGVSQDVSCVLSPDGVAWGASGIICTMRDFAKIGELILNRGAYLGEQLIPLDYMTEATTKQIDTVFDGGMAPKCCGYGYQIWMEPYGYGMHGLGGQFAFCFPEKSFLFVCNANTEDSAGNRQTELYAAAARLYKAISDSPLPASEAAAELSRRIQNLSTNRSFGESRSPYEALVGNKTYLLNDNPMKISSFRLEFGENCGTLRYVRFGEEKALNFGYGKYEDTTFPETNYYGMQITKPSKRRFRALVTGSWTMENRLLIITDICDTNIGTAGFVFEFSGTTVSLKLTSHGEEILHGYSGYTSGKQKT